MAITAYMFGQRCEFLAAPPDGRADADLAPWVNPATLRPAERLDLRRRIEAGEIDSIRFRAVVFGDEPNLNRTRPRPGQLESIARGMVGRALNYDHRRDIASRKGTVLAAQTRVNDREVEQLVTDAEITDRQAMLDFVDGKLSEFSISILSNSWSCSECSAPAQKGWFGPILSCDHDPDAVELFGEAPTEALHLAAVTEGAYRHTGVESAYSHANQHGGQLWGCPPANLIGGMTMPDRQDHGPELGALMRRALMAKAEAEEMEPAEVEAMLEEEMPGFSALLSGDTDCPEEGQLGQIAEMLRISVDEVRSAAESDGCSFGDSEEEPEDMSAPAGVAHHLIVESDEYRRIKAELAAVRAEQAAQQFDAAFNRALAERRVTPAMRESIQDYCAVAGIEKTRALLESFAPRERLSGDRLSHEEERPIPDYTPDPLALAREAVRLGLVNKKALDKVEGS